VQTGYWELDFVGTAISMDPDFRLALEDVNQRVAELEKRVVNLPDRIGGGGGTATWQHYEE